MEVAVVVSYVVVRTAITNYFGNHEYKRKLLESLVKLDTWITLRHCF